MAAFAAVARIAYLASDVVVDSHPPLPAPSRFGSTLDALRHTSKHQARVLAVPAGGDPGSTLLRHAAAGSLVSYTAIAATEGGADAGAVSRLLAHAPELAAAPLVAHLAAAAPDLAGALALRAAFPFVLHSATARQARDHALLASRLAAAERRAVLHVFDATGEEEEEDEVLEEGKVLAFLAGKDAAQVNGLANGHAHVEEQDPLFKAYEKAASATSAFVGRPLRPLVQHGDPDADSVVLTFGRASLNADNTSFISVSLFSPFPAAHLSAAIPPSATRILVLEQIHHWSMKWTPFYLETVKALQEREPRPSIASAAFGDAAAVTAAELSAALASSPSKRVYLGSHPSAPSAPVAPHVPKHEASYTKILEQLFSDRLDIVNAPSLVETYGPAATTPEFALGRVRSQLDEEAELSSSIQSLLEDPTLPEDLHTLLSRWTLADKNDGTKLAALSAGVATALAASALKHLSVPRTLALLAQHAAPKSRWIIGSDAWAYDLGASGLHHAIASGLDVNILVLDTLPYSARLRGDPHRRKQDVGLYAMNHGDVFVASVAVYSSYAQVLQALVEADRFRGPSVVLAYLPYAADDAPALDILKETKLAVDAGYWPLYRWDPARAPPFVLDSDAVKNDLRQFLDRQNHLSQLTLAAPQLAAELVGSLGARVRDERRRRARAAFDALVGAIDAPPLLVLFASDGGKAEKVAKRLAARAKARGLSARAAPMDSVRAEDLAGEGHVAFVTSVAGQGEFPQNGRQLVKALGAAAARGETGALAGLHFAVFGMGDSHYWPRPEDAHYYNKAGRDLDGRLAQLGGERFAELGLGDDQDPDGPETGYKLWEPRVWKALGVDAVEVREAEPEPITNEHIKAASGYLRGTIADGLEDASTGALAPADTQLTKFHGIYQQDDRDVRDERQAQGAEPAYAFMIRVRLPGGVCTPAQWLAMDRIADERGNGTFKITTRQTFQFHGVIKRHLKPSIQAINRALLDTLAACGDVNR
jgi:sulfite reductase (NADPH) hemoprotein beta-component